MTNNNTNTKTNMQKHCKKKKKKTPSVREVTIQRKRKPLPAEPPSVSRLVHWSAIGSRRTAWLGAKALIMIASDVGLIICQRRRQLLGG